MKKPMPSTEELKREMDHLLERLYHIIDVAEGKRKGQHDRHA